MTTPSLPTPAVDVAPSPHAISTGAVVMQPPMSSPENCFPSIALTDPLLAMAGDAATTTAVTVAAISAAAPLAKREVIMMLPPCS